jgi:hypothetical protein
MDNVFLPTCVWGGRDVGVMSNLSWLAHSRSGSSHTGSKIVRPCFPPPRSDPLRFLGKSRQSLQPLLSGSRGRSLDLHLSANVGFEPGAYTLTTHRHGRQHPLLAGRGPLRRPHPGPRRDEHRQVHRQTQRRNPPGYAEDLWDRLSVSPLDNTRHASAQQGQSRVSRTVNVDLGDGTGHLCCRSASRPFAACHTFVRPMPRAEHWRILASPATMCLSSRLRRPQASVQGWRLRPRLWPACSSVRPAPACFTSSARSRSRSCPRPSSRWRGALLP